MRRFVYSLFALCALSTTAMAEINTSLSEGFNMGAGRWQCGKVIEIAEKRPPAEFGQVVGWVLGSWSMATAVREESFVGIVETVGATKIFEATIGECRKVPPEIMLFRVVNTMIERTKAP
ncbi:MAG: 5'-methylthioadenosine phosphorylase [Pseudomonadota bacterium]